MSQTFFVMLGGTITMDADPNGFKSEYDARHLLTAAKIQQANIPSEEKATYYKKLTSLKKSLYCESHITQHIDTILNDFDVENIQQLMHENHLSPHIITPLKSLSDKHKNHVSKDGLLDSINFDFSIHFEKIKQTLATLFSKSNRTAIVFGGTDTLEFYAPALSAELNKHQLLTSNNLTFLSSMACFEANPAHVAKLVNGALASVKNQQQQPQTGAYILSPNLNRHGKTIGVTLHELSKHIVKISSKLKNAFRSDHGITQKITFSLSGIEQTFTEEKAQTPAKTLTNIVDSKNLTIAPPLIAGNSPKVIISFLDALLKNANEGDKYFDIVPIESNAALLSYAQSAKIISYIRALALKDIQVAFIKDKKPTSQHAPSFAYSQTNFLKPMNEESEALKQAGTLFLEGPINALYVALHQGTITPQQTDKHSLENNHDLKPLENEIIKPLDDPIKIKYIPDQTMFKPMLTLASNISNHIVIEALPGQTIPDYYQNTFVDLIRQKIKISIGFKYNGSHYNEDGHSFTEGTTDSHDYAASKWLKEVGVEICGSTPPAKVGLSSQSNHFSSR